LNKDLSIKDEKINLTKPELNFEVLAIKMSTEGNICHHCVRKQSRMTTYLIKNKLKFNQSEATCVDCCRFHQNKNYS